MAAPSFVRVLPFALLGACAAAEAPPARGGGPTPGAETDAAPAPAAVAGVPLRYTPWGPLTWEGPGGPVVLADEVVGPPACRGSRCAWVARVGAGRTGTLFVAVVGAESAPAPAVWGPVGEADRLVWEPDGGALVYVAPRAGRATVHRWVAGAPAPVAVDAPVPTETPVPAPDGSLRYTGAGGPVRLVAGVRQ